MTADFSVGFFREYRVWKSIACEGHIIRKESEIF